MAWKCSKCGMPNYKEGNCVLCGEPMPENPEEYVDLKKKKEEEPFLPDPDRDLMPAVENDIKEQTKEQEVKVEVAPEVPEPSDRPVVPSPRTTAHVTKSAAPAAKSAAPAAKPAAAPKKVSTSAPAKKKKTNKGSTVIVLFLIIALSAVCIGLYTMIENLKEAPTAVIKQSAKPTITATVPPSAEPTMEVEPSFDPYADPVPSASGEPTESAAPSVIPSESPVVTPSESPAATPKPAAPTTASKKTVAPTKTPAPAKTPKPVASLPSKPSAPLSSEYKLYTNGTYGFACAYPAEFYTDGNDASALQSLRSSDYTAYMNIRAQKHDGSSAEKAMNNYLAYYGAPVLSKQSGDNWYIASFVQNDRVFYRKAYISGNNLICFDFSYRAGEADTYEPMLSYIGKYFYKN